MKRLLDESTDELTRSLLRAGAEHRPPSGNKRQLIVAMGAGGALGLFSSNAFAWLGTTAGKVTAAGVAVGVAGAVLVAGPLSSPASSSHERQAREPERAVSAAQPASQELARLQPVEPPSTQQAEPGSVGAPSAGVVDTADVLEEATAAPPQVSTPSAARGPERLARGASSKKAHGKKASARKARSRPARKHVAAPIAEAAPEAAAGREATPEARRAALDAEVRLVDDMHRAARRDDREALARLVAAYRSEFPDGQLEKEVADFEASLAQPNLLP